MREEAAIERSTPRPVNREGLSKKERKAEERKEFLRAKSVQPTENVDNEESDDSANQKAKVPSTPKSKEIVGLSGQLALDMLSKKKKKQMRKELEEQERKEKELKERILKKKAEDEEERKR